MYWLNLDYGFQTVQHCSNSPKFAALSTLTATVLGINHITLLFLLDKSRHRMMTSSLWCRGRNSAICRGGRRGELPGSHHILWLRLYGEWGRTVWPAGHWGTQQVWGNMLPQNKRWNEWYLLDAKHFLSASQVFVIRLIFETPTKYAFHFLSGQVSVCNKYEVSFGMTRNVLKRMLT